MIRSSDCVVIRIVTLCIVTNLGSCLVLYKLLGCVGKLLNHTAGFLVFCDGCIWNIL